MDQQHNTHAGIAAVLALTMALGPLALDTYLPAFPLIAQTLGVSSHRVSLSISLYIFVLAFGQLCGGPLSDRFGRSKIMLIGMGIFAIASFLLANATSLSEFLALRVLQAFGGGWATVTVPALVRDRLSGIAAAKFFSLIGLLMILAPAVAPSIGSLLLSFYDWQHIFIFLGIYSLVALVLIKTLIFSHKTLKPMPEKISVWQRYKQVISTRAAMRFMFIGTFAFSVLMLFITHASYIYQSHFGLSVTLFSLLFSANVLLMLIMNISNRRLLKYFSPEQIVRWSLSAQGLGLVLLIIFTSLQVELWLFVAAMVLTLGVLGAVSPNIQACYMEFFHHNGGTAAALMGATQFSIAGLISAMSTLLPETILFIILCQALCSILCLLLIWTKKS